MQECRTTTGGDPYDALRDTELETKFARLESVHSKLVHESRLLQEKYYRQKQQLQHLFWNHLPRVDRSLEPIPILDKHLLDPECENSVVGDYRCEQLLGRGQFASVRACTRLADGSGWAIKCVKKSRLSKFIHVTRIKDEIDLCRTLRHPNVINVVDVMHGRDSLFIIMSRGDSDLFELLGSRAPNDPLPQSSVTELLTQLLRALAYLHKSGVCHRDIKPENVVVDGNLQPPIPPNAVRLVDFGLATRLPAGGQVYDFCGSPGFFAPELISTSSQNLAAMGVPGAKTDVWSTGAVVLECILEHALFKTVWLAAYSADNIRSSSVFKQEMAKAQATVLASSSGSAGQAATIWRLLQRMLELDPVKRSSSQELLDSFSRPAKRPESTPQGMKRGSLELPALKDHPSPSLSTRTLPGGAPTPLEASGPHSVAAATPEKHLAALGRSNSFSHLPQFNAPSRPAQAGGAVARAPTPRVQLRRHQMTKRTPTSETRRVSKEPPNPASLVGADLNWLLQIPTGLLAVNPVTRKIIFANGAASALLDGDADSPMWLRGMELHSILEDHNVEPLADALAAGVDRGHLAMRGRDGDPHLVLFRAASRQCSVRIEGEGGKSLLSSVWLITLWPTGLAEQRPPTSEPSPESGAVVVAMHELASKLLLAEPDPNKATEIADMCRHLLLTCSLASASPPQGGTEAAATVGACMESHRLYLKMLNSSLRSVMETALHLGGLASDGDESALGRQKQILAGVANVLVNATSTTNMLKLATHTARHDECNFEVLLHEVASLCRGLAGPCISVASFPPAGPGLPRTDPNLLAVLLLSLLGRARADAAVGAGGITIAVDVARAAGALAAEELLVSVRCAHRCYGLLGDMGAASSASQHAAAEVDEEPWMGASLRVAMLAATTLRTLHGCAGGKPFEVSADGRSVSVRLPLPERQPSPPGDTPAASQGMGIPRSRSAPNRMDRLGLPQAEPSEPLPLRVAQSYRLRLGGTVKVLIADDAPMMRQMACLMFQTLAQRQPGHLPPLFCHVTTALSAEEAVRLCRAEAYHLVVTDENFSVTACRNTHDQVEREEVRDPEMIQLGGLQGALPSPERAEPRVLLLPGAKRACLVMGPEAEANISARCEYFRSEAHHFDIQPADGAMTGTEGVEEICASGKGNPIFMHVSSSVSEKDCNAYLASGTDLVLPKPFKTDATRPGSIRDVLLRGLPRLIEHGKCTVRNGLVVKGEWVLGEAVYGHDEAKGGGGR